MSHNTPHAAPAFDLDALCTKARADLVDDICLNASIAALEVAMDFNRARKRLLDQARQLQES